jgi:hypothetical protein
MSISEPHLRFTSRFSEREQAACFCQWKNPRISKKARTDFVSDGLGEHKARFPCGCFNDSAEVHPGGRHCP